MLEASIGAPQRHLHLTVFPIVAERDRSLPYLLLADAMASGLLTIQELGDGTVPMLGVKNQGKRPVLIIDGEQLIGAKQNRMTNRTILLAPESVTEIPVSCMEEGRWHFVSDEFQPAPHHAPSKVRSKARRAESRASRDTGSASHRHLSEAQGEVWDEIRKYEDKLGRASDTGALDAMYRQRAGELDVWLDAFPPVEHQVGLLAFTHAEVLGMDALGAPSLYLTLHRRILTGYVMDALAAGNGTGAPDARKPRVPTPVEEPQALEFVEALRTAAREPSETVGLGEYRILKGSVLGGELVQGGQLVHLSAFPLEEGELDQEGSGNGHAPVRSPITGPKGRRRRF